MRRRRAEPDARMAAVVTARAPLLYASGADAAQDRPAHVRAASGIAWLGGRLAVVQDDASFVALVDLARGIEEGARRAEVIALPPGPGGLRQFDDGRGNKADKLDLEAAFTTWDGGRERLVALGSGASPARRRALLFDGTAAARIVAADDFYLAIEATPELAGSELNLEGAALLPDGRVRLFQRGNGAARRGLLPVDATWDLPLAALLAYLDGAAEAPRPHADDVVQYDLGAQGGVRLTFTDAAWSPADDALVALACAERSPDAIRDGEVLGSVLLLFDDIDGASPLRCAPITGAGGAPLAIKAEGLAFTPDGDALVVLDADDPARPSELCLVELTTRTARRR
jgi:hypothetical protein